MTRFEIVQSAPRHKGQKELLAHLSGKRLSYKSMIISKCYECMGYMIDGASDCNMPDCPLYPSMPYGKSGVKTKRTVSQNTLDALKRAREAKK